MAEAPIFDIDEFLRVQAGGAPAQSATAAVRPGAGYKLGKAAGKLTRFGAKFGGPLAAGATLAEGLLGDATVPNAIRTGVGIGAIVNPTMGVPLATGMAVGGGLTELIGGRMVDAAVARNDIRGPATREFQARQVAPPTAQAVAPTVTPADITLTPRKKPKEEPAPVPAIRPPTPTFRPLPQANVYRERPGVRGIGGIGGIGNTEIVGQPDTSSDVGNTAGNFLSAILGMKQITGDKAYRTASQKLEIERRTQGAIADRATAAADLDTAKLDLVQRVLDRGGSPEDAAAVLAGRGAGGGVSRALPELVIPSATGPQSVPVFNPRTNTIINMPVQQQTQIFSDSKGPYRNVSGKKVYLTPEEQRKLQKAQ